MHIHMHTQSHTHTYIHLHTGTHTLKHFHTYAHIYSHTCTHTCTHTLTCTPHTHIHTQAHRHTHTQSVALSARICTRAAVGSVFLHVCHGVRSWKPPRQTSLCLRRGATQTSLEDLEAMLGPFRQETLRLVTDVGCHTANTSCGGGGIFPTDFRGGGRQWCGWNLLAWKFRLQGPHTKGLSPLLLSGTFLSWFVKRRLTRYLIRLGPF